MAEDSGEKTEQPTTKKKEDARKRGQTLQSKDLTLLSAIASIFIYYIVNYKYVLSTIINLYSMCLVSVELNIDITSTISQCVNLLGGIVLLPIIIGAVLSLVVNVGQMGGIILATEAMQWKLDKFNMVQNLKNIFSKKNLVMFVKYIAEVIIMVTVSYTIVKKDLASLLRIENTTIPTSILAFCYIVLKLLLFIFLIYLTFALIEFVIEAINLKKQLMMSLEEIKKEYKESEGSPQIKQERMRMHREILEGDGGSMGFDNATMVVANPTHIAIVLFYSPKKFISPIVIFKATGFAAKLVFKIADRKKIPILRNKWLAQELYALGELKQPVPPSLTIYLVELIKKNIKLFPNIVAELQEVMKTQSAQQMAKPNANVSAPSP